MSNTSLEVPLSEMELGTVDIGAAEIVFKMVKSMVLGARDGARNGGARGGARGGGDHVQDGEAHGARGSEAAQFEMELGTVEPVVELGAAEIMFKMAKPMVLGAARRRSSRWSSERWSPR